MRNISSETALIRIETFERAPVYILRGVAIVLLLLGLFGTFVAFNGGWERRWTFGDDKAAWAILWSLLYYGFFCAGQWGCKAKGGEWMFGYFGCVIMSVVPNFLTYSPFIVEPLNLVLPSLFSYVIAVIFLIFADMLPEWVLLK